MKKMDFEKFLLQVSQDLYGFAFILIPDDLQAGQLVADSVQAYVLSKKEFLVEIFNSKNKSLSDELILIKRDLLKNIYELAKKRYQQLKLSLSESSNKEDFYSLEFDEKATLYLKEKLKWGFENVAVITAMTKSEISAYLYSARIKMIEKIPYEIYSGVEA
jgi:hypothetical protein